jgi:hypothetical protein
MLTMSDRSQLARTRAPHIASQRLASTVTIGKARRDPRLISWVDGSDS